MARTALLGLAALGQTTFSVAKAADPPESRPSIQIAPNAKSVDEEPAPRPADSATNAARLATDEAKRAWIATRTEEFRQSTFTRIKSPQERVPLELRAEPVLNWSNPVRAAAYGGVFIWTDSGVPQVAACTYPNGNAVDHEFSSLCDAPLILNHVSGAVRSFTEVPFLKLPDAPPPSDSRVQRLVQMRHISEEFTVGIQRNKPEVMRRLAQPIYRHPADAPFDGALFAYVQGTDPEALLILQAGDDHWKYAFARMTVVDVRATRKEKIAWEVEWFDKNLPSTYWSKHYGRAQ